MCLMSYANNTGADQPAHPRSLISAFVVRCLDSIIFLDSIAFKTLASFCGCTGRFVSGVVGNSRRNVLSCRCSIIIRAKGERSFDTGASAEFMSPKMHDKKQ